MWLTRSFFTSSSLALWAIFATLPASRVAGQTNDNDGSTTTVTILHVNDHHSHYEEQFLDLQGERIPPGLENLDRTDQETRLRVYYGGAARTIALMKAIKAEISGETDSISPNTTQVVSAAAEAAAAPVSSNGVLTLHAGDAITGSLYYTFFGTAPDAAVLNVANFDAFVLGNHEFTTGDENLAELLEQLNIPTVSYNLRPHAESALLRQLAPEKQVKPFVIKQLPDGTKIGICGMTTKRITEQASRPDAGTTFVEEEQATRECVAELEQEHGINKIVLLSHLGYDKDQDTIANNVGRAIQGVDVIIGAHTHSLLDDSGKHYERLGLEPRGEYAQLVNGVCIVQAWEYFRVLGQLQVTFDAAGKVTACRGSNYMPLNPNKFTVMNGPWNQVRDLNETEAQLVANYLLEIPIFKNAGEDQQVLNVLDGYHDRVDAIASQRIATAGENICHVGHGDTVDDLCPERPDQTRVGGGVCLLAAQGFLHNVLTADFAIQNSGGCRDDIVAGDFTYGNAFSILPFTNTLVTLKMTGEQIRLVLEDAFNFFLDDTLGGEGGVGAYPIGAGLRWNVDYTKPFGQRVSSIEMNVRLEESWKPLDLERTFIIVTNDFLSGPRDGYFEFGNVDKENPDEFQNTYVEYAQSLINYASALGVLEEPPLSLYSTQWIKFIDGEIVDLRSQYEEEEAPADTSADNVARPTAAPTPATGSGAFLVTGAGLSNAILVAVSALLVAIL